MSAYRKSHHIRIAIGRSAIAAAPILGLALAFAAPLPAKAHPGHQNHNHVMKKPLAGIYNNYWYDYKSDVDEAENELRKDLRRAKTAQDKREAWQEHNRELSDGQYDYRKEMVELGYIRRGEVIVGG